MKKNTPLRAIRQHCLECSGHYKKEVKKCLIIDCPLYQYRFGKMSSRKGIGSVSNFTKKKNQATKVSPSKNENKNPHSSEAKLLQGEREMVVGQHSSRLGGGEGRERNE
jgi:hypothetical protein